MGENERKRPTKAADVYSFSHVCIEVRLLLAIVKVACVQRSISYTQVEHCHTQILTSTNSPYVAKSSLDLLRVVHLGRKTCPTTYGRWYANAGTHYLHLVCVRIRLWRGFRFSLLSNHGQVGKYWTCLSIFD